MRIKLTESERYSADAPKYLNGLVFVQSGTEKSDIENMAQWLRRLCKKHDGLSSMLISSNHEAKEEIERKVIHKHADKITIAAGERSADTAYTRAAKRLAALMGREVLYYPGGHNLSHDLPREFAACVTGTIMLQQWLK